MAGSALAWASSPRHDRKCLLSLVCHPRQDRRGNVGPIAPRQAARLDFIVKNVASRDFSLVVLILSLFNLLGIFLWFAAIGSNLFWMTTAWLTRSPAVRA